MENNRKKKGKQLLNRADVIRELNSIKTALNKLPASKEVKEMFLNNSSSLDPSWCISKGFRADLKAIQKDHIVRKNFTLHKKLRKKDSKMT